MDVVMDIFYLCCTDARESTFANDFRVIPYSHPFADASASER